MTHTHTPLIIEGKIYVVVDAPDFDLRNLRHLVQNYRKDFAACTKYETLPEHAPYWEERIGQRVEVEITNNNMGETYAIPPQQKQGDEWDEAEEMIESDFGIPIKNLTGEAVIFYLRNNYSITKK